MRDLSAAHALTQRTFLAPNCAALFYGKQLASLTIAVELCLYLAGAAAFLRGGGHRSTRYGVVSVCTHCSTALVVRLTPPIPSQALFPDGPPLAALLCHGGFGPADTIHPRDSAAMIYSVCI